MKLFRLFYIIHIFFKYALDESFKYQTAGRILFFLGWLYPGKWYFYHYRRLSLAVRLRMALEELGPIFIKLGQMLSVQYHSLSPEMIHELSKLQDHTPHFSGTIATKIIEDNLHSPIHEIFENFEMQSISAGSIAQIHTAQLKYTHADVVIKICRPDIQKKIKKDIALLFLLSKISHFLKYTTHLKLQNLVKEIEYTLQQETNLLQESANASQLRRHMKKNQVIIPKVYWEYTTQNMIVFERIFGTPLNQYIQGNHPAQSTYIAKTMINIFFTQVFRDRFFHADWHPGNIFIIEKDQKLFLALVDFGMMGCITSKDQHYLYEIFFAIFERDYGRVVELHIQSGWISDQIQKEHLIHAIRAVCEPELKKQHISISQLMFNLLNTAMEFKIAIQPQLSLLQKTLLMMENLTSQLDPQLHFWKTARPHIEKWATRNTNFFQLLKLYQSRLPPHLVSTITKTLALFKEYIYNKNREK